MNSNCSSNSSAALAFVFPGQGSQSVGLLAEMAALFPQVKSTFAEASQGVGCDLWELSQNGPELELNRTENTQPVLLAAGVAVWRIWLAAGGIRPAILAGHSLGEYTALVCAGALPLDVAAALVAERGRLMQAAVPAGSGAMAAVLGGDEAQIAQACIEAAQGQVVAPANFNSPEQTVIAGNAEAVDRALARLVELGVRKVVKLPVSVPSHCTLMENAAKQLETYMAKLNWKMPTIPVVQNAEGQAYTSVAAIQQALVRQLYLPVRWTDCVRTLVMRGVNRVAECGPGKVLGGLVKRIDKSLDMRAIGTPLVFQQALQDWSSDLLHSTD